MQSDRIGVQLKYATGIYEIQGLRICPVPFDAQVEVFKIEPISRGKPTAFVAGHAYEKHLGDHPIDKVIYKAQDLGSILGTIYTIIYGHCSGTPSYAAMVALAKGAGVIGLSPFSNKTEHWQRWSTSKIYAETEYKALPEESATIAIHTGVGYLHRDVFNVVLTNNHRQHVYVVGGHEGTNHEVDAAVAEHAIIGALLGVGGISGDIKSKIDHYERHGIEHHIMMDTDPKALVEKVMEFDKKLKEENGDRQLSTTPLIEFLDTLEDRIIASPSP